MTLPHFFPTPSQLYTRAIKLDNSGVITGDMDIDYKAMLKSAITAGAVAGVTTAIDLQLEYATEKDGVVALKDLPYSDKISQEILHGLARSAITGEDIKTSLATGVGNAAFEYIGHDVYAKNPDFPIPKTVTHSLIGGALSELAGGDFSQGAISTAVGHVVADALVDQALTDLASGKVVIENNPEAINAYVESLSARVEAVSSVVAGAVTLATHENVTDEELAISQNMTKSVVENNTFYMFSNKLVATDGINNSKVVDLTLQELYELGLVGQYSSIIDPIVIGQQNLSQFDNVYNLTKSTDFNKLRLMYTDMAYFDINKNANQVFWNGMDNTVYQAIESKKLIQNDFGTTGLIANRTHGLVGDASEWLPKYKTTKDVLNAYTLSQLAPETEVITHSAGNEDDFKALEVGSYVGMKFPINIISVGSPRSKTDLQNIGNKVGVLSVYQYNNPHDPVANGLLNGDANYEFHGAISTYYDLKNNHPFLKYYPIVKQEMLKVNK